MLKAVVYEKYGPPEVLQLREVEKPFPKYDEVIIKVHATTVSAIDCVFRRDELKLARLFTGFTKLKNQKPGREFAGEIKAVGKNVKTFCVNFRSSQICRYLS